jgi:SAM-dependent methyltransferase
MIYEHLHRYYFSRDLVAGREVLDLGSGEGYGSNILAGPAARVVGAEIDPLAVAHARKRYPAPNLTFVESSALDLGALADDAFDAVVCFELIEHLSDHDRVVAEIARVLRPDGFLIMSTPDRLTYSDATGHINPHHLRELSGPEFGKLLSGTFPHVAIFEQQAGMASSITPATGGGGAPSVFQVRPAADGWELAPEPKPLYLLAVASRVPLPDLPSGSTLLDPGFGDRPPPERVQSPIKALAMRGANIAVHAARRRAAVALRERRRRREGGSG